MSKPVRTKIVQTLASESSVRPELMEYEMRRAEAYVALNLLRNIQRTMLHMFPNITDYKNIYRLYRSIEQKNTEVANLLEGHHTDPIAAMFSSKINLTGVKLISEEGQNDIFTREYNTIQLSSEEQSPPTGALAFSLSNAASALAQQVENDYEAAQRQLANHVAIQDRAARAQLDAIERQRQRAAAEAEMRYYEQPVRVRNRHNPDEEDE